MNLQPSKLMTIVINMDSAKERMAAMKVQLDRLDIPYVRLSAVDGTKLSFPHSDFCLNSYRYLHGRLWSPRELGCYLSHIECFRQFLKSDAQYALVLEDDASLPDDLLAVIDAATHSSKHWNLLRLSTVNHGKWWPVKKVHGRSLAVCLTREKGAGAYVVDRHAARQMIKYLLPMRLAWDIAFDLEWFFGFKMLGVVPMPVSQSSEFETQIQSNLPKMRSRTKYLTVLPFRLFLESTRLLYRTFRLLRLRFI
jgi:glycosyl transferase, family 25